MRVFFLILDAFDPVRLNPHLTPNLWRWANADGAATGTGQAVMAACTYPNHASFITGVDPDQHGIFTNHVIRGGNVTGAWDIGPLVPTLFDSFGAEAVAVLGDHHLVGVMGARAAASHWPANGEVPLDIALDPLGYPSDDTVVPHLLSALGEDARFIVGYFGSIDSYSHIYGPQTEEVLDAYRRVDARMAAIDDALTWDDTVVIVVSDHTQDTAEDRPGIDLRPLAGENTILADEGSSILIGATIDRTVLLGVDGVVGARNLDDGNTLAWCAPGRFFGPFESPVFRGVHGNQATRTQLALVTGGHPSRYLVADAINAGSIPATAWAGLIRQLLR